MRVAPWRKVPSPRTCGLSVSAAANEAEAVQLVLKAGAHEGASSKVGKGDREAGGFEEMNRRQFIGGAFALAGAAAWAKSTLGRPNLKVGILSDIHVSPPDMFGSQEAIDMFEKTLSFFRREKVDAVLIAGDLTNDGLVRELKTVADTWARVFGGIDRGPARIFVTGNHEKVYFNAAKRKGDISNPRYAEGLYLDVRKNWRTLFKEEWSPFFIKTVKGYSFVGAHWAEWNNEIAFREFMSANRGKLEAGKPFFYTQHAHPQNTCYGPWIWHKTDGGPTDKVLADYPNAVAFSGHTHYTITDERSVWQGSFTSLGTGALRWLSLPSGRENGPLGKARGRRMSNVAWGSQGMVMSVWDERMVFERYDFVNVEKVGDDWVVPILRDRYGKRAFSFESRRARAHAPEFPAKAKIKVVERTGRGPDKKDEPQVVLSFPAASGRDSLSRPFDYEVRIEHAGGGVGKPLCTKRVYQPGVQWSVKRDTKTVTCVFGKCELPSAKYRFSVIPFNSLGQQGRPIYLEQA